MVRSVGAVLAGFATTVVLALGADAILRQVFPASFAPGGEARGTVLVIVLVYTAVFAVAGAWLTARVAPAHPLRHALILGAVALALSLVATIFEWSTTPDWYHIAALALVLPACWLGGTIVERREPGAV
jgi:hypothetical protein